MLEDAASLHERISFEEEPRVGRRASRPDQARADRRRRDYHPLERPCGQRLLEACSGARRGLHGHRQAAQEGLARFLLLAAAIEAAGFPRG
jgi:hypothetical protein